MMSTEATARAADDRWALEWRSGGSIRAFAVREAAGGNADGALRASNRLLSRQRENQVDGCGHGRG